MNAGSARLHPAMGGADPSDGFGIAPDIGGGFAAGVSRPPKTQGQIKSPPSIDIEAPMSGAVGAVTVAGPFIPAGLSPKSKTRTITGTLLRYTYATHTGRNSLRVPRARQLAPPGDLAPCGSSIRIRSLPQSRLRMGQEYYPSVRYPRARLQCIIARCNCEAVQVMVDQLISARSSRVVAFARALLACFLMAVGHAAVRCAMTKRSISRSIVLAVYSIYSLLIAAAVRTVPVAAPSVQRGFGPVDHRCGRAHRPHVPDPERGTAGPERAPSSPRSSSSSSAAR